MIYRNWSLLSSTVVICGSVATAGLAGIFLFGGKVTNPPSAITVGSPDPSPDLLLPYVRSRMLVIFRFDWIGRLARWSFALREEIQVELVF
jgi:hypothetical protein